MGTITSASAAAAGQAIPTSSGEITVADILCASGVHGPGVAERYWHHQWAVILITRGGYRVGVDPQQGFDAEAGDLVIMRPETDHAWTTVGHPRGKRNGDTRSSDNRSAGSRQASEHTSRSIPMICSAMTFVPRGIIALPRLRPHPDSRSECGFV